MSRKLAPMVALTLALALPDAAAAQAGHAREALVEGRRSIAFGWPFDGGGGRSVLEVWKMRSQRKNLGWQVGVHANRSSTELPDGREGSGTQLDVTLGPVVKRYLGIESRVAPYLRGDLAVGVMYRNVELAQPGTFQGQESSSWSPALSAAAGVGVDWFPFERVSVGGSTGLRVRLRHVDGGDNAPTTTELSLDSFLSPFAVSVYF